MNIKHVASFLMLSGVAFAPHDCLAAQSAVKLDKPRIEVCFVLDTTGSMSGLIEGAKQKIWSIANEMARAKPTPDIRMGLIGYRDRGDEYIIKTFDLTNDLDAVYGHLRLFSAGGGGDTPESVNEALESAVKTMSWSADRSALKLVFLVGDAPPHMDYAGGPKYPDICQAAVKKDLIINTVQCGNIPDTQRFWQEIAALSEGSYAAIAQSGNMEVVSTPMDAEMAELNRKLGTTLVAYGGLERQRAVAAKQVAAEAAPAAVAADRLAFNASYGLAVQGEGELVQDMAAGRVQLEKLDKAQLPEEFKKLSEAELKTALEQKQKDRAEIQTKIQSLSKQREEYLAAERKKAAEKGRSDSFDEKVAGFIRAQGAKKGIQY
jgi:Mg-chelatase subunit ChlD